MTLIELLTYYKSLNQQGTVAFQERIPDVKIRKVVEEALKGNYHLSMVFSETINVSEKDFVLTSLNVLEYDKYDVSDELSNYTIKEYSYNQFINKVWFPDTKKILTANNITEENSITIFKLRDKDHLTFLVKTNTQYVFIQEIYWKS